MIPTIERVRQVVGQIEVRLGLLERRGKRVLPNTGAAIQILLEFQCEIDSADETSITLMGLDPKIADELETGGIDTIEKLLAAEVSALFEIPGIGAEKVMAIQAVIDDWNMNTQQID